MSAAEVLMKIGASVTLHDQKDASLLGESLSWAKKLGFDVKCGSAAYEGIEDADFVVVSPGVPESSPGLTKARAAGVAIYPEIELAYRISCAPIIAITGTNGKTTTTALVGAMLRADGRTAHIAGNIVAGDIRLPLTMAALDASPDDVIVAEISSFQLESISTFKPKVSALLNITGDHLDRYKDIDEYARAKARIFEYQDETDFAVVNPRDALVMQFAPKIRSQVWEFNRQSEVSRGTFLRGTEVWARTDSGAEFVCDTSVMKLRGTHNLENVLAASAIVLAFGASKQCVGAALEQFAPPEHRLEPVAELHGVEFLNNSMCTNVDASVRSLEAIGRPAVVIAGGKDKGLDYTRFGEAFREYARHVVLIGVDAKIVEAAALRAGFDSISHAASMEEAVEIAWRHAVSGDTVVLCPCCASFDMFKDFEDRGRVFKSAVRALVAREAE
jgi:UDP-N-acetylmuramoylalanine--D-glutamate ligase